MNKALIEIRMQEIIKAKEDYMNQIIALDGAYQYCQYWLETLKKLEASDDKASL
jgi:lipase chaperone LimK